ncbi:MAG: hypothetical protein LBG59_08495 [Candidatus Peribacteria bacterium]|nr:hypothetical protein [Candidatus Peribacteria bacterium]
MDVDILNQADTIQYEVFLKGLSEDTIRSISADLQEPDRMLQHRIHCLEIFRESKNPTF